MNKVELAKMIGLEYYCGYYVDKYSLKSLLENNWAYLDWEFCDGKVIVSVDQDDFTKAILDIKEEDLVEEGDIKTCIKQVEDLLWERAADKYLEMVHNSAMLIGGK